MGKVSWLLALKDLPPLSYHGSTLSAPGSTAIRRRADRGRHELTQGRHFFTRTQNGELGTGVVRSGVMRRNLFAGRRRKDRGKARRHDRQRGLHVASFQ